MSGDVTFLLSPIESVDPNAAEAMRRIPVDSARRKQAVRHGSGQEKLSLELIDVPIAQSNEKSLQVNEYLEELKREAPEKAQVTLSEILRSKNGDGRETSIQI